jgi:holo-ACP synthase
MGYSEEDILMERSRRRQFQKKLIERFNNPLLLMRVNYPLRYKKNNLSYNIIQKMDTLISDIFSSKIQMRIFRITAEGPIVLMILKDDPYEIKKLTVQIEDKHILGQCIDIDVYTNESCEVIKRIELGLEQRCCPICGGKSKDCKINFKHNEDELTKFVQDKYRDFMESFYGKTI